MSTLNARSMNRIAFHTKRAADRTLLLQKYPVGSAGYERTMNALQGDYAVIADVQSKLGLRAEAAATKAAALLAAGPKVKSPRGRKLGSHNTGTYFSIVLGEDLESCNDNRSGELPQAS